MVNTEGVFQASSQLMEIWPLEGNSLAHKLAKVACYLHLFDEVVYATSLKFENFLLSSYG